MIMKKILFVAAIAALGMSACSQDEELGRRPEENAVEFGVYNGQPVRAAVQDLEKLKETGFSVFAFNHADDWATEGTTAKPNFMYDQAVTYDNGSNAWTYSPVKYWPTNGSNLTFFAYAPTKKATDDNITALSANTGAPTLTFTPNADVSKQVDLLHAVAADQAIGAEASKKVTIPFKHALAQIKFAAKLGENFVAGANGDQNYDQVEVTVTKAEFSGTFFKSANLTLGGDWDTWNPYTAPTDEVTYTIPLGTTTVLKSSTNADYTDISKDGDYLMIIPFNKEGETAANKIPVTIKLTYTIKYIDASLADGFVTIPDNVATVNVADQTFVRNSTTTYQLTLGLKQVDVDPTIENWATQN